MVQLFVIVVSSKPKSGTRRNEHAHVYNQINFMFRKFMNESNGKNFLYGDTCRVCPYRTQRTQYTFYAIPYVSHCHKFKWRIDVVAHSLRAPRIKLCKVKSSRTQCTLDANNLFRFSFRLCFAIPSVGRLVDRSLLPNVLLVLLLLLLLRIYFSIRIC